jgi:hypothetical protein
VAGLLRLLGSQAQGRGWQALHLLKALVEGWGERVWKCVGVNVRDDGNADEKIRA